VGRTQNTSSSKSPLKKIVFKKQNDDSTSSSGYDEKKNSEQAKLPKLLGSNKTHAEQFKQEIDVIKSASRVVKTESRESDNEDQDDNKYKDFDMYVAERYSKRAKNPYLNSRIFENPQKAEEYLRSKTPEKNIDYSFMDRNLLYQQKTIDQSYKDLRKKNNELINLVNDITLDDENRVSRISARRTVDIQEKPASEESSGGFFTKLNDFFTCIGRKKQPSTKNQPTNRREPPKKY